MDEDRSTAWKGQMDRTAMAVVVAVLDVDNDGVNAILSNCTPAEAAQAVLSLAEALVACCEPHDRPVMRAAAVELLQSTALDGASPT